MERTGQPEEPGSTNAVIETRAERGNILLIVLLFLVAAGVLAAGLLSSLMGEIQGTVSYRHAVGALSTAEAGIHYAVARINATGGSTFTGEANQQINHPTQGRTGVFDVSVRCSDGTTLPAAPNPCAAAAQPNVRVITSTGYVPSKALSLGRRTVAAVIRQETLTSLDFAVCGRDGVTLDRDTNTYGSVGSNLNIALYGPPTTPGSLARTHVWGAQRGDATAGGSVTCSGSCGPPYSQVAGVTTPNYPGQVCPELPPFFCSPSTESSGDRLRQTNLTISAAAGNTVLRNVQMEANSVLNFATTSDSEVLTVHMNTLIVGRNSRVRVTGPGKVLLYMAGRTEVGQGSLFGVNATDNNIPPGRLVMQSCASDSGTDYAIEFHQTGAINAVFFAPNGQVQLDQASLSSGAIHSRLVRFDQGTRFSYDTTGFAISAGKFNTLTSWRELP